VKSTCVIDTNVILRYLLDDHPTQSKKAKDFMSRVKTGDQEAFIPEGVLIECVYVLLKFYHVPRSDVASSMLGILNYRGVINPNRSMLVNALLLFDKRNVDLVDAIVQSIAEEYGWSYFSFDKDLEKLTRV
jgi:predicted nucleic-acid-binding protein